MSQDREDETHQGDRGIVQILKLSIEYRSNKMIDIKTARDS